MAENENEIAIAAAAVAVAAVAVVVATEAAATTATLAAAGTADKDSLTGKSGSKAKEEDHGERRWHKLRKREDKKEKSTAPTPFCQLLTFAATVESP